MTQVFDTPDAINTFRLLALRGALKLEILGMTKRGQSAYSIIKQEFGFKGSKEKVLQQLNDHVNELKKLVAQKKG
jgi:anion-transporting  ArsA/GET3 family ATPase